MTYNIIIINDHFNIYCILHIAYKYRYIQTGKIINNTKLVLIITLITQIKRPKLIHSMIANKKPYKQQRLVCMNNSNLEALIWQGWILGAVFLLLLNLCDWSVTLPAVVFCVAWYNMQKMSYYLCTTMKPTQEFNNNVM